MWLRECEYIERLEREGERVDTMYKAAFAGRAAGAEHFDEGLRMLDDLRDDYVERLEATAPGETEEERITRLLEIYARNEALNAGFEELEKGARTEAVADIKVIAAPE